MVACVPYISCMHKTTLYLEPEIYEQIQRRAAASGRTQASIIREALTMFLGDSRPQPASLGLGASGSGDLSERSEDLLEGFGES